ncbi:hypothetical protein F2Q70_00024738 [Brassica cretica]|uniref:ELYS-like domain-containing protein n=1 Tax=Brassica cretica TaxID=69181 RepID=A0A8S9LF96_BRACR|nr:hypothetical protein F2Q70_00024738 [Brassica cretica]
MAVQIWLLRSKRLHSLLESFVFYLLDDPSEDALEEACKILPEISGPETYPKVAQVLLERENPETALMVMRWSGRDDVSELVSIGEAVTAVRVRVECRLLSEAFTYQRTLCLKVKEHKLKNGAEKHVSDDPDRWSWKEWMKILVNEFCCLSIRRNVVDRIIELPWNPDEEKYLHRCLLDSATDDPSSAVGSLLVVFYLQRYRYIQAYQVHFRLQKIEEAVISENQIGEEAMIRMLSQSRWRKELVPSHMIGSASHGRLFTSTNRGRMNEVGSRTKTLKFGEASTPFKDLNKTRGNSQLKGKRTEETCPETNVDRFMKNNNMSSPYLSRATANNPVTMKRSSNHLNGSAQRPESTFFGTRMQPDKELMSLDDPVDMSSRLKDNNNVLATESRNNSGGLRWRSYEASDEEEPNWGIEPISSGSMPVKGRRRRFAAR